MAADTSAAAWPGALHAGDGPRVSLPEDPPGGNRAGPVDLLTAGPAELERLPGVGPVLAARIAAWRAARTGPWSLEDLTEVRGVGPTTLERLRAYLEAAGGSSPDSARGGL